MSANPLEPDFSPWLVTMNVTLERGGKKERVSVEVAVADSESAAIRIAFLRHFGVKNKPIHAVELVRVIRVRPEA